MAINHPQGASWFTPMSDVYPPFEDLAEQDERQRARNEPDYEPDDEPFIREEWFKKVPEPPTVDYTSWALRAVPSFDIEIRFPTRAVRHMMSPQEARDFANAILRAVRQAEKDRRIAEARHRKQEG